MKKRDVIETEANDVEVVEEKKGNIFSNTFNKAKKKVGDSMLEMNIASSFEKNNKQFTIYVKDELLSHTVYGYAEKNSVIYFGKEHYPFGSVIIDEDDIAYYLEESDDTTVTAVVDGVEYERPGVKVDVNKKVEEVKVVKAGKRYFIYKGK